MASMLLRLLVTTVVLLAAPRAQAYCLLTTEMPTPGDNCAGTGIGLKWRRSCMSFSMQERAEPEPGFEDIRDVADVSFVTWMQVSCEAGPVGLGVAQTQQLGECDEPEYNQTAPNANTIIFIDNWIERELPPDAFGLTLVWHNPDDGEIYDADMQINETLGALAICGAVCPEGRVDLQNVITHEAGHFFGLGHSNVRTATMSARASVGEISKRDLSEDDRAGLCAIYGTSPRQRCESSDFMPDNGFSPVCWTGQDQGPSSRGLCSVTAPGGVARPKLPGFGAALALLALLARRRRLPRTAVERVR
jgi:hypothetical protein